MAVRNIIKQLAGEEDLLLGKGIEEQIRNNKTLNITKIDLIKPVDLVLDLKSLDTNKYTKAMTLGELSINDGNGCFYWFDSSDITTTESSPDVIVPNSIVGRWKRLTLKVD